jgi:uncharacterized SAM-binding protein YcdF (DUF218 family)
MMQALIGLAGGALLVDGLWLMALDKTNFGTVLPAIIGAALLLWSFKCKAWQAFLTQSTLLTMAWRVVLVGFAAWLVSVLVFFTWLGTRAAPAPIVAPRVILSLGSGLVNNQPTPTLVARLDEVLRLAQQYPNAQVMTTGGVGRGQTMSEAQAMANYLMSHGLAPQRLLLETRSTSTHENVQFARALLPPDTPILITSSDFHLPRAQKIAQRAYLNVVGTAPAPTPLQIRYNAWLREYFAFISGYLLNEYWQIQT